MGSSVSGQRSDISIAEVDNGFIVNVHGTGRTRTYVFQCPIALGTFITELTENK